MIVQIFDVFDSSTAKNLTNLRVDHIGIPVIPADPKAGVTVEKAKNIVEAISGKAKSVVLTPENSIEEISKLVETINPDIIQLQASLESLNEEKIKVIRKGLPNLKLMRAIPVTDEKIIEVAKIYEPFVDFFLLDSLGSQFGATGKTHDWNISKRIVESVSVPVILAGGLGPDNGREAIEKVNPYGVDSKTKTDFPDGSGKKDLKRVEEFVRLAKLL